MPPGRAAWPIVRTYRAGTVFDALGAPDNTVMSTLARRAAVTPAMDGHWVSTWGAMPQLTEPDKRLRTVRAEPLAATRGDDHGPD